MADNDFQVEAIGEVYARALVNLAQTKGVLDAVVEDVRNLGQLLDENKLLADFFHAVTISPEEKMAAIDKIFAGRMHPLTIETLKSMARRDRLMFIRGLIMGLEELLRRMRGETTVEVTSATELPAATLTRIGEGVGRALGGKTPELTVTVDPRLVGGVRVQVGDTLIDGSVDTQLKQLRRKLETTGVAALQTRDLVGA